MNRVLSRATKLSKIIGKANIFTKVNISMNLKAIQTTSKLINFSKMSFADYERNSERRFEKFADSTGIRQGKHNIRTTLSTERINVLLDFIEKNAQSFNDGDYFDCMHLLSQKIEQESTKIAIRRPAIKLVNDFAVSNFQKYSGVQSNTFLQYLSALAAKDIRLISRELTQNFVQKNIAYLDKNHSTLSLYPLLNTISMLGLLSNINPVQYIKGRDGELSGISLTQLMRVAKRLAIPNQSSIVRGVLTRFIANELFNKAQTERILQKSRILNVLCKIDSNDPLLNLTPKIRSLIKLIVNELDQLDNVAILPIVDAMIYWDDYTKSDFLSEINDVVSSTITHSVDSIYPDFFLRYLDSFSKIKGDSGLTSAHLKMFLEFYLKNKKPEEIRNPRQLICFFTVMKKCKLYEKAILEPFFDITLNSIPTLPVDDNLFAYRYMVSNHLGEEYLNRVREIVKTETLKVLNDSTKQGNVIQMFYSFSKLCFFNCEQDAIESGFNIVKNSLIKTDFRNFYKILESYVDSLQEHLKPNYRDGIVTEILNRLNPQDEKQALSKLYIYLNECLVSRENEELKKKIAAYTTTISEHAQFKSNFIKTFENLTNSSESSSSPITNMSFSRYIFLLRESIKEPEFIQGKEKHIILNILQTTLNITKMNKQDSKISEDLLNSFLRIGNDIVSKYPNTLISLSPQKLSTFLKAFSTEDLDSPLMEKLSLASLNSISEEKLAKDISMDLIVLLERLSKTEKTKEKIELIKKVLGSEEKIKSNLENSSIFSSLFKLLSSLNKIDSQLVSEELIIYGKDFLIKKLKEDNYGINNKLNILYALSNTKNGIISENEIKELGSDIQNIFVEFSTKRLVRTLSNAPSNISRGSLSRVIHMKYANLYEKEENSNKILALRTLDRFTAIRWPFISLYNKFISDYGNVFDKFNSFEHVSVINYLSRVNIAREDIIKTACNAISMQIISENDKLNLFKGIVKLGFYKPDNKTPIIDNLISGIDHSSVFRKQNISAKIQLLFDAWKLSQNGYEVKSIVEIILENLSKINVERGFEARRRYNFENITYFLLHSQYSENLDENTKKYLSSLFQTRKTSFENKTVLKILTNYLSVMNNKFEEFPESNHVDVYLPESNIGIIFVENSAMNIFDKKPMDDYVFIGEELAKRNITPIFISISDLIKNFKDSNKNHETFIEKLESIYSIPNKNTEKKYDFTALEQNLKIKADNVDEE